MASDENDERAGFAELLAELGDSDVVIEVVALRTAVQALAAGAMQRLEAAVERPTVRLPVRCASTSKPSRCSTRRASAACRCGCGSRARARQPILTAQVPRQGHARDHRLDGRLVDPPARRPSAGDPRAGLGHGDHQRIAAGPSGFGRAGRCDRRLAAGEGLCSATATRCGSSPTTVRRARSQQVASPSRGRCFRRASWSTIRPT